jgi:hypothetical protein
MNLKTNVLIASRERINSSEVSLWQNYQLVMLKGFLRGCYERYISLRSLTSMWQPLCFLSMLEIFKHTQRQSLNGGYYTTTSS